MSSSDDGGGSSSIDAGEPDLSDAGDLDFGALAGNAEDAVEGVGGDVDAWELSDTEIAVLRPAKLAKAAAPRISIADLTAEIQRLDDRDRGNLIRKLSIRTNAPTPAIAQAMRTTLVKVPEERAAQAMQDALHYGVVSTSLTAELKEWDLAAVLSGDRERFGFLVEKHLREALTSVEEFGLSAPVRAAVWSAMVSSGRHGSVAALGWLVAAPPPNWNGAQVDAVNTLWAMVRERVSGLPEQPITLEQLCETVAEMELSGELDLLGDRWRAETYPDEPDGDLASDDDSQTGDRNVAAELADLVTRLSDLSDTYTAVRSGDLPALVEAMDAGRVPGEVELARILTLAGTMSATLAEVAPITGGPAPTTISAALEQVDEMVQAAAAATALGQIARLSSLVAPEYVANEVREVAELAAAAQTQTDPDILAGLEALAEAVTIGAGDPRRTTELVRTVQSTLPSVAVLVMLAGGGTVRFDSPAPSVTAAPDTDAEDEQSPAVPPEAGETKADTGTQDDTSPAVKAEAEDDVGVRAEESDVEDELYAEDGLGHAVPPADEPTVAESVGPPATVSPADDERQPVPAAPVTAHVAAPAPTLTDVLADFELTIPDLAPADTPTADAATAASDFTRSTPTTGSAPAGKHAGKHAGPHTPSAVPVAVASSDPEDESDDLDAIEGIDTEKLYAELLDGRHYSLAAWLTEAIELEPTVRVTHRLAAHAAAIRTSTGPNAAAFSDCVRELNADALHGKTGTQLLLYAASVRAGLLSPTAGAAGPLRDLTGDVGRSTPAVSALTDALLTAVFSGAHLTARSAEVVAEAAELEAEHRSLVAAARVQLDTASSRTIRYQAATELWRLWMSPGEYLGAPLGIVASGSRSDDDVRTVRDAVARLRNRSDLEQAIDQDTPRTNQTRRVKRIEARARDKVIDWASDVAGILGQWVEATENLNQSSSQGWMASQIRDLRDNVNAVRADALAELTAMAGAPGSARNAVVGAALKMLEHSLDMLSGAAAIEPGQEMAPDRVVNGMLTLAPDLPLTASPTLAPRRKVTVADISAATSALSRGTAGWTDTFNRRSRHGDQVGTQALVESLRSIDADLAKRLTAARDREVIAATADLDTRVGELAALIDTDRRFGRLTSDGWAALSIRARAFDASARGTRRDFDVMFAELAAIETDREKQTVEVVERTWQQMDDVEMTEEQAARVSDSIDAGDITTADEYLELVRARQELPTPENNVDHLARFFPTFPTLFAAPARGASPLAELKSAIVARSNPTSGRLADALLSAQLDVAQIGRKEAAAGRIDQWRGLTAARSLDGKLSQVKPILEQLGFYVETANTPATRRAAVQRASWMHVTGVRATAGEALIPAFGTAMSPSGNTLRILAVWGERTPQELVELLAEEPREHSVVVLYFGTLGIAARAELASVMRASRSLPPTAVIDDAAFAYLIAQPEPRRDITMLISLPFSAAAPFTPDVAGLVPTEMFYGRAEELDQVKDMMGSCLVYGGRQLGKSALLRAAARDFDDARDRVAIYQSIYRVGGAIPVTAVWTTVWPHLAERGIVTGDMPAGDIGAAVVAQINAWVTANPDRRLLLLLDESDSFLDADSEDGKFTHVTEFKELMERTGRAVKVVFAGLHQTARFERLANHPLAHLGNPVCVGPLASQQAYRLLTRPLMALGYRFPEDNDAARVLALANNQPALIQVFGAKLLSRLQRSALPPGAPPQSVGSTDIEAVWADESLRTEFRKRFEWTLNLDPRYRIIAYTVAFHAHAHGVGSALSPTHLRSQCEQWWPQGFAARDVRTGEFRALLDECVSLGVLSYDSTAGAYRLRTPNVLGLLGTREEVDDVLDQAEQEHLPESFDGSLLRPSFGSGTARSPLTSAQIADLLAARSQVRLIAGSAALNVDWCAQVLREQNEHGVHGKRAVPIRDANAATLATVCAQAASLAARNDHALVFVDLKGATPEAAYTTWRQARDLIATYSAGSLGIVLLTTPAQSPMWGPAATESDGSAGLTELHRYDTTGLRLWLTDTTLPFQDQATRTELLEATGGWPSLINRTVEAFTAHHDSDSDEPIDPLARIRSWLAQETNASAFLASCGVDTNEVIAQAWAIVVANLVNEAADTQSIAELMTLAGDVGDASALAGTAVRGAGYTDAVAVVDVLRTLSLLVSSEVDGQLRAEPTAAQAAAVLAERVA